MKERGKRYKYCIWGTNEREIDIRGGIRVLGRLYSSQYIKLSALNKCLVKHDYSLYQMLLNYPVLFANLVSLT